MLLLSLTLNINFVLSSAEVSFVFPVGWGMGRGKIKREGAGKKRNGSARGTLGRKKGPSHCPPRAPDFSLSLFLSLFPFSRRFPTEEPLRRRENFVLISTNLLPLYWPSLTQGDGHSSVSSLWETQILYRMKSSSRIHTEGSFLTTVTITSTWWEMASNSWNKTWASLRSGSTASKRR